MPENNTPKDAGSRDPTNAILRDVSRSFYLSIRVLPERLRDPVSLAYLLARSTDTLADTAKIPRETRIETLGKVIELIQGKAPPDEANDLMQSFVPLQTDTAEKKLLESLPACLAWLERLESQDRDDVREVLAKITRGQTLDLERFEEKEEVRALAKAVELDQYTYLVAGSVGEFWTRLCFRHIRKFATMSEAKMLALGKQYGMGLQLVNILRDAGTDLRNGRCYFPEDELTSARLSPSYILREPERFQPIYRKWIDKAERGLESGIQYARATRNLRVRAATAMPAIIGRRTLALLRAAGPTALKRNIRVPRSEVRKIVTSIAISLVSRKRIDALFSNR